MAGLTLASRSDGVTARMGLYHGLILNKKACNSITIRSNKLQALALSISLGVQPLVVLLLQRFQGPPNTWNGQ